MLTNRKANCVKLHIFYNKFFSKIICQLFCNFHINTKEVFTAFVFKGFELCVCSNYKLVFFCIFHRRSNGSRFTSAEVFFANLIKSAVFFNFVNEFINLCEQFRLIFINTKSILFFSKIDVDNLYNISLFAAVSATSCKSKEKNSRKSDC